MRPISGSAFTDSPKSASDASDGPGTFESLLALAGIRERGKECSLSSATATDAREFMVLSSTPVTYSLSQRPAAGLAPDLSPQPFSRQQNERIPLTRRSPVIHNALTFSLLSMVMAICILLPRRKATKWSVSSSLSSGTLPGPGKHSGRFSLTIRLPCKGRDELTTPSLALCGARPGSMAIPTLQGVWWQNRNRSHIVSHLSF